jgi:hypothetical protein
VLANFVCTAFTLNITPSICCAAGWPLRALQIGHVPSTTRLVEIRHNQLRFPLMPPGPKQFFCDAE